MSTSTIRARSFVPQELNPMDWAAAELFYRELFARDIHSPAELEKWLLDFSELTCVMDECGALRYIAKSCHTEDKEIERRYMQYLEEIDPKVKPLYFELQKKFLASPHLAGLADKKYFLLVKRWRAEVEIFRAENVKLETESRKLVTEYDSICGVMMVNFRGKELTLQQTAKFLEEPDRATRQEAWELIARRRHQDHERVEDIFEGLLELRDKIAKNAGMEDFRAYAWKAHQRFDYSPEQCLAFADSIAKTCVPLVDELDRQRKADLGLGALRPWDIAVDPKNRPALKPFAQDDTGALVAKTKGIIERLSPALAEDFDSLRQRNNLDLDSRKGKQPGGYQANLNESRQPFIFMNAAGVQGDIETLLHEAGHAFHHLATAEEDLLFLRNAPMEFSEVASMSIELLGSEHLDLFYDQADAARAKRTMLEGIIKIMPWIATIDLFQHWLYTHPGHSRAARDEAWLGLLERFSSKLDWSGYEAMRAKSWQRQLHLFDVPFNYVEYGIAQLGALQLWVKSKSDPHGAIANYRSALKLGGTRSVPELFAAAGLVFDFSEKTLRPLIEAIGEELADLPQ